MSVTAMMLLVCLSGAMPGLARASATVYGRAHVSVDLLDDGADYTQVNVSTNSARLGFKAEKETTSGISGFMQIEGEVTYNQGNSALSNRDTFVGLKGVFGMVRLGQYDTPFKAARGPANLFGDQLGDMRNFTRVGDGRFDERTPNTIHYQSPRSSGLQLNIAYSVHEGTAAQDGVDDSAVSASVSYREGDLDAAVAFEAYEKNASRGKRHAIRAAIAYSATNELKMAGFFQTIDHDDDAHDATLYGVGGTYKMKAETTLNSMVLMRSGDGDDATSSMVALGVEHRLDRTLRVYANGAMVLNDDDVELTPWNQGRSISARGAAGQNATGVSLGVRYDF